MAPEHQPERRRRTLTEADLEAIRELSSCHKCAFTAEEVQFVKSWLETAKEAKSEFVRWMVRAIIIVGGLICGLITAHKMGWIKL